jgi:hypothetical protein
LLSRCRGLSKPFSVVLALAYAGRWPRGRMPPQLCSILPGVTRWPRGGAPDNRHDLFIGLDEPSKTQPAGFKRAVNLPSLRVMAFSTAHDRLLVPVGWEPSACRVGAEHRESPRHSWDVAECVEYWSRTLTRGSQLCKECKRPPLWRPCDGRRDMAVCQDPGFQPGFALPAEGG